MNNDLTIGNPEKVLWKFCLPLFGSIIFQQLYNIADSWVAGRYIGENALASVGNSYEISFTLCHNVLKNPCSILLCGFDKIGCRWNTSWCQYDEQVYDCYLYRLDSSCSPCHCIIKNISWLHRYLDRMANWLVYCNLFICLLLFTRSLERSV